MLLSMLTYFSVRLSTSLPPKDRNQCPVSLFVMSGGSRKGLRNKAHSGPRHSLVCLSALNDDGSVTI